MENLPSDLLLSTHRSYGIQRSEIGGPGWKTWKTRTTRPAKTTKQCAEWNNYWRHHYSSWYTLLFVVRVWKYLIHFGYCVDEDLLRSFLLTPSIRECRKDLYKLRLWIFWIVTSQSPVYVWDSGTSLFCLAPLTLAGCPCVVSDCSWGVLESSPIPNEPPPIIMVNDCTFSTSIIPTYTSHIPQTKTENKAKKE